MPAKTASYCVSYVGGQRTSRSQCHFSSLAEFRASVEARGGGHCYRRDSCAEPFGGCCPDRAVSPTTADQSPRSQAALLSAALSLASAKIRAITTLPTSARCSGCRTSYYQWDPSDRTLFCRLFRGAEIFPDAPTASLIARLSGSDRLLHPKPGNVQRGKKDQRQHGRDQQSTHDRVGHRSPKYRGRDRDHAEHRRYGGEHDGAEAGHRGLDHRIPYRLAFRTLIFDLIDEDHRVARDHPEQRQNAENGHKPERFLENEKRGDDPDQPHRNDAQDEEKTAEAVQLHHQDGDNDEQHQGNHREDRVLRLRALLDRPAHRNVIGPR